METYRTREKESGRIAEFERDRDHLESAERRLNRLVELNAEFASVSPADFPSAQESLSQTAGYEKAFSFLGLCMGVLPPLAFFVRLAFELPRSEIGALFLITLLVCSAAAATGYFTGKVVGKIVRELDSFPWPARFSALPFVGLTWGILAGGAGGALIFLFGAIPGAVIGAAAGFAALPVFATLHSALRQETGIEKRHLYPAAIGVAGTIAAFILGFPSLQ